MAASGDFEYPIFAKIDRDLYSRSAAISNMKLIGAQAFSSYFHKMAAGGHFCFFLIISKFDRVLLL